MDLVETGGENIEQLMLQMDKEIEDLLALSEDHKQHGELIGKMDSVIDKIDQHIVTLQTRFAKELDKRIKEFEEEIKLLDDHKAMIGSKPPSFLAIVDIEKWYKLASPGTLKQQLVSFKRSLLHDFRENVFKQLQVEKLTEQNITIRRVLDKIRQTLLV